MPAESQYPCYTAVMTEEAKRAAQRSRPQQTVADVPPPGANGDLAPRSFEYRPNLKAILAATILCVGGGAFFLYKAAGNSKGLIINGLIRLGPDGATTFYYVAGVILLLLAGLLVCYFAPQAFMSKRVTLYCDALVLPRRGWSRRHCRVRPEEVLGASIWRNRGLTEVTLRTTQGKFKVNSAWFSSPRDFEAVVGWLFYHVPAIKPAWARVQRPR